MTEPELHACTRCGRVLDFDDLDEDYEVLPDGSVVCDDCLTPEEEDAAYQFYRSFFADGGDA